MRFSIIEVMAAALLAGTATSAAAQVDPLTATVDDSAAQRFAEVWRATNGVPTSDELQSGYLDHGGRGVEVFTRGRIQSAEWLAKKVADNPDLYRNAVERCLPWVAPTTAQLRSTYLGLSGLFPDRPLPEIAVVIGADNSGGTAAPGIQVIGLEVICRLSPTRAEFEERIRQFFAHETIHTFQSIDSPSAMKHFMITSALAEGVPDLVTKIVTARMPNSARDEWARSREEWIWHQFLSDAAIVQAGMGSNGELDEAARAAHRRWFANAGDPPEGWPDELGYWVGMRIAEAYVTAAPDPHVALEQLLTLSDPAGVLEKSRYPAQFGSGQP